MPRGKAPSKKTLEEAVRRFSYDPITGTIVRRVGIRGGGKEGSEVKCLDTKGYARVGVNGVTMKAHRLAWFLHYGDWPDGDIDHKNGIRDDNRICNLRLCDGYLNNRNRAKRSGTESRFKGVYWNKSSSKWMASLQTKGNRQYLGLFDNEVDAAKAWDECAKENNYPPESLNFLSKGGS